MFAGRSCYAQLMMILYFAPCLRRLLRFKVASSLVAIWADVFPVPLSSTYKTEHIWVFMIIFLYLFEPNIWDIGIIWKHCKDGVCYCDKCAWSLVSVVQNINDILILLIKSLLTHRLSCFKVYNRHRYKNPFIFCM